MLERDVFVKDLLRQGATNEVIIRETREAYGSVISTSRIAAFRKAVKLENVSKEDLEARALELFRQDYHRNRVRKVLKEEFGRSFGYPRLTQLWEKARAEAPSEDDTVQPLELPAEVHEAPLEPVIVPPPALNGALGNIKATQAWMKEVGAQSLTLTAEGKLSVLVLHELDIGDAP